MPIPAGYSLQDAHRLFSDFWADAISWQNGNGICSYLFFAHDIFLVAITNNMCVFFWAACGGEKGGRSCRGTPPRPRQGAAAPWNPALGHLRWRAKREKGGSGITYPQAGSQYPAKGLPPLGTPLCVS